MSTSQAPAPVITRAATRPTTPRKLFVNLPVANVQRAIRFFEALGFEFNPHFTDASAAAMLVGEDAFFMLLAEERFQGFSGRPLGDRGAETNALLAVALESREAVEAMVHAALAAGGTPAKEPQDHGFMFGWSFRDLDGHHWEPFWMDPSAIPGGA